MDDALRNLELRLRVGACLDEIESFIIPQRGLLNYLRMGSLDVTEMAMDVSVVSLGRTVAKSFDDDVWDSLLGGG